jgi:hypothetical protein
MLPVFPTWILRVISRRTQTRHFLTARGQETLDHAHQSSTAFRGDSVTGRCQSRFNLHSPNSATPTSLIWTEFAACLSRSMMPPLSAELRDGEKSRMLESVVSAAGRFLI